MNCIYCGLLQANILDDPGFKSTNELFARNGKAQTRFNTSDSYKTGIGLYGGLNSGITFKHHITDGIAFEVMVGSRWKGLNITGLYEACVFADYSKELVWNFGIGPRIGFYNGKNSKDYLGQNRPDKTYSLIGFVGSYGIEYCFKKIPITLSLDYRPFYDMKGDADSMIDGAFTLRYTF